MALSERDEGCPPVVELRREIPIAADALDINLHCPPLGKKPLQIVMNPVEPLTFGAHLKQVLPLERFQTELLSQEEGQSRCAASFRKEFFYLG